MTTKSRNLGIYSGIIDEARRQGSLYPVARPGAETQAIVRAVLGWCNLPEAPRDLQTEKSWEHDGLRGEELSWDVGYGPRTRAWLIRPAGAVGSLPGVLALHDHGGFKFHGKEKIAEGEVAAPEYLRRYWRRYYGGRAWVNALAREGFAVLAHDTFLWGSRGFPFETMQQSTPVRISEEAVEREARENNLPKEIVAYNQLSGHHEHLVSKYCNLLGTSIPGVVAHEDRIALKVLRERPEIDAQHLACMGLSGGGGRAGLLRATAEGLKAAVIVGMMSTYEGLLDHNVNHTWMFYPFGWARHGEWPDLAACQAPAPLLVQFDLGDELFTEAGMRAADERLRGHYEATSAPENYTGQFYPGPHKFDVEMQEAAINWLKTHLR